MQLEQRIKDGIKSYNDFQKEMGKSVTARQKLEIQLQENEMVKEVRERRGIGVGTRAQSSLLLALHRSSRRCRRDRPCTSCWDRFSFSRKCSRPSPTWRSDWNSSSSKCTRLRGDAGMLGNYPNNTREYRNRAEKQITDIEKKQEKKRAEVTISPYWAIDGAMRLTRTNTQIAKMQEHYQQMIKAVEQAAAENHAN